MTKLYISGPMTGLPEYNFPLFKKITAHARSLYGHEAVVCPTEINQPEDGRTYAQWLARDIAELVQCDTIVYLPRWQESKGATLEMLVALILDFGFIRAEPDRHCFVQDRPPAIQIVRAFVLKHFDWQVWPHR